MRCTSEAMPVPIASTSPSGTSASTCSASRRASSASPLESSGASAFQDLPAGSREPTSDGTRLLASHPPTRRVHRSASGRPDQRSNSSVGSHEGVPSAAAASAIRPAVSATSTTSAAPGSSTCSSRATALRSRTASPPLRSTLGGCTPQWSSSSSTRRTTSKAAPAAVRATSAASRADVASGGTSSTGSRVVRPPRSARPTSPGSTTASPSRGTSRRRLISSSAGVRASAGETVRRADPVVPSPPWSSTWRSSAVAAGDSSAIRAVSASGLAASGLAGRSPLTRPGMPRIASATPVSARTPPGASQASARSSSRCSAAAVRVLVGVDDRDQVRRSGLTCNQEGIKHGKLEAVQSVEGPVDRRTRGGPRGELRRILRGGCGEIWTGPEQRHEPVVRPAAQLVGEGACGCRPP